MKSLDPRSPLVVDTREMGRRPGASQRLTRTSSAPAELGSEVIGVSEGSDLRLDLLLEAVMEGVLVSGTVSGTATGSCVRCLADLSAPFVVRLQELYAYTDKTSKVSDDLLAMEGDLIPLESALRDAIVPTLPFQPVCRDDCPGLPTRYGVQDDDLADEPSSKADGTTDDGAGETADDVDPRWAALLAYSAPERTTPHDHQRGAQPDPVPDTSTSNKEG